jgi:hypothetical protein
VVDGEESRIQVEKENNEPREHKKTKSFIDHFRKTIEESFSEKHQEQPKLNSMKQPLREIQQNYGGRQNYGERQHYGERQNYGERQPSEDKSYSQLLKECVKEPVPISFKTVYLND